METTTPVIAFGALVVAFIDLLRYARGKDWDNAFIILASWAAGVGATLLAAQTDFADGIPTIGGIALSQANFASLLVYGLTVAAAGNVAVRFTKALDANSSVRLPGLLNRNTPPQ